MDKNKSYKILDSGCAYFWSIWAPQLLSIAVSIIFIILASILGKTIDDFLANKILSIFCVMVSQISFIIFFVVFTKKRNVDVKSAINFEKMDKIWKTVLTVLIMIAIAFILVYFSSPFISLINYLLSKIGYQKPNDLPFALDSVPMLIVGIFTLAVLPAVCEETIFRGIVNSGLVNSAKSKKAKIGMVFVGALIFASIHLAVQQFVYPFIVGLVLGFVYLITKNIVFSMILHFTSNCIVVVSNYISTIKGTLDNSVQTFTVNEGFASFGFFVLSLAIVFGLLVALFYMKGKSKVLDDLKPQEEIVFKPTSKEQKSLAEFSKKKTKEKIQLYYIFAIVSAVVFIVIDFISYFGKV